MDHARSIEIVTSLAAGFDPITGEVFPDGSSLQHPEVVRALFFAAGALQRAGARPIRVRAFPPNAGRSWTEAEDARLAQAFDAGTSERALAQEHQRTPGAIRSRLVKLGKVVAEVSKG